MAENMAYRLELGNILGEKFEYGTVKLWCDVVRGYHAGKKLPDEKRMLAYFTQRCTERPIHSSFVSNKQTHQMVCENLNHDIDVARAAKTQLRAKHIYTMHYKPIIALENLICEYNRCNSALMCFGWDEKTHQKLKTLRAQIALQKSQVFAAQH